MTLLSAKHRSVHNLARKLCYTSINDDTSKSFDNTIKPILIEYAKQNGDILRQTSKKVEYMLKTIKSHIPPSVVVVPGMGDMLITQINTIMTEAIKTNNFADQYSIGHLKDIGAINATDWELHNAFELELWKQKNYSYINDSLMFTDENKDILPIQDRRNIDDVQINYTSLNSGMIMAVILKQLENGKTATMALWGDDASITTTGKELGQSVHARMELFPHLKSVCTEIFEMDAINIKYIHLFIAITGFCYAARGPLKIMAHAVKDIAAFAKTRITPGDVGHLRKLPGASFFFVCASIPAAILESTLGQIVAKSTVTLQYSMLYSCLTLLCGTAYVQYISRYFHLSETEAANLLLDWDNVTTNYYARIMIVIAAFTIHVITACLEYMYIILYRHNGLLLALPPILATTHWVATNTMLGDTLGDLLSEDVTTNMTTAITTAPTMMIPTSARFSIRKFRSKTKTFLRHTHFPHTTTL
jgi:hypothetical protein